MWYNKEDNTPTFRTNWEEKCIKILNDEIGLPSRVGIMSEEIVPMDKIKGIEIKHAKDLEGNDLPNKYCIIFNVDKDTAYQANQHYAIGKAREEYVSFDDRREEYKIFAKFAGSKKEGTLYRVKYAFTNKKGDDMELHCYMYK